MRLFHKHHEITVSEARPWVAMSISTERGKTLAELKLNVDEAMMLGWDLMHASDRARAHA